MPAYLVCLAQSHSKLLLQPGALLRYTQTQLLIVARRGCPFWPSITQPLFITDNLVGGAGLPTTLSYQLLGARNNAGSSDLHVGSKTFSFFDELMTKNGHLGKLAIFAILSSLFSGRVHNDE